MFHHVKIMLLIICSAMITPVLADSEEAGLSDSEFMSEFNNSRVLHFNEKVDTYFSEKIEEAKEKLSYWLYKNQLFSNVLERTEYIGLEKGVTEPQNYNFRAIVNRVCTPENIVDECYFLVYGYLYSNDFYVHLNKAIRIEVVDGQQELDVIWLKSKVDSSIGADVIYKYPSSEVNGAIINLE